MTFYIKQHSTWEADSERRVQEMPYITLVLKLKIVTVLVISDHEWAKNEISVTLYVMDLPSWQYYRR